MVLKIINAILSAIRKVIDAFRGKEPKDKKSKKKKSTAVLVTESARLNTYDTQDWDVIEKNTVDACVKITAKIKHVEKTQTETLKKLEKFCEEREKANNESSITNDELDSLIGLL